MTSDAQEAARAPVGDAIVGDIRATLEALADTVRQSDRPPPTRQRTQMDRAQELAIIRLAYAKQILAEVQVSDARLEQAFAEVPREDFLGPGPWVIPRWSRGYLPTPSADPVYLYIDNVVQIIADKHLNNGQPSGHAKWIASTSIKQGEHVLHVGTGTGYYTAIMAHLAGSSGEVTGIELDADPRSRSFRVTAYATRHPKRLLPKRSRRVAGNGSLVCTEMAMYLKTVAGFALQDGALRGINGRFGSALMPEHGCLWPDPADLANEASRQLPRVHRRCCKRSRKGSA